MASQVDVTVVGAGPGGAATALELARHGLDVLLVDKAEFPRDKTCGDGLTPRAVAALQAAGILAEVADVACQVEYAAVVSPRGQRVRVAMPAQDLAPAYMLTLPRFQLDDIIRRKAIEQGAEFRGGVHVQHMEPDGQGVAIWSESGRRERWRSRLAVVAVGANTRLLQDLGALDNVPEVILAARAYYAQLPAWSGDFEFHFDGVPLPGYGWIFPLPGGRANVGVGVFRPRRGSRAKRVRARPALDAFLQAPSVQTILQPATRSGPVKGFPIRTDFTTARTYVDRTLLVGEAAGLVNPLTGEGIDYALESGLLAAQHILDCFAQGDFSLARMQAYDMALRQRFQRLFRFCQRLMALCANSLILDGLVYAAARRPDLRQLLAQIVLGNYDMDRLTRRSLLRAVLRL